MIWSVTKKYIINTTNIGNDYWFLLRAEMHTNYVNVEIFVVFDKLYNKNV